MRSLIPLLLGILTAYSPAQGQWFVSPTGSDSNAGTTASAPFRTLLQAAQAAAPGDVIRLAAGTYGDEQGLLAFGSKELSFVGAGVGTTILRAPSSVDQSLPNGTTVAGQVNAPHRVVLSVRGSARVDLRDLTLDCRNAAPTHGRTACLFVCGGAEVVCDRVDFVNSRPQPLFAAPSANGIVVRGDAAGNPTNLTMRNCLVRDYAKNGVLASFEAGIELEDCRIDGVGHTDDLMVAQLGVRATSGARVVMRRVTITDHWHTTTNALAAGVSLLDCGNVIIADCSIGNCEYGVFAVRSSVGPSPVQLRRNTIHGADVGVYVLNAQGILVQDNSIHCNRSVGVVVSDNGGGNQWVGNYYSNALAEGPLALAGSAGAYDLAAKPGLRGFGVAQSVALPSSDAPVDLVTADLDSTGSRDFAALTTSSDGPALCIGLSGAGQPSVSRVLFGGLTSRPIALVDGEFDGQPGRDLAALTASIAPDIASNSVHVFANNGSGAFSVLAVIPLLNAVSPSGLAVGNLDGGLDDLVATDAGAGILLPGHATLLRNSGAGVFAASQLPFPLTAAARDAVVADTNGDGNADIAVAEGSPSLGAIHVLLGNGSGSFVPMASSPLFTSPDAQGLCATDLDGDLDVDLLATCVRVAFGAGAGALDVFENLGGGAFERTEHRVDQLPKAIVAGRLDGLPYAGHDRRDIALVDLGAGAITVCNGYARDAGFAQGGIARWGVSATSVALADMDGDGLDDLVYADAAARAIVTLPRSKLARTDAFGPGAEGTSARIPVIRPVGASPVPSVPAPEFGIGLTNGLPNSLAVLAVGLTTTPLLIDDLIVTFVVFTDVDGGSNAALPIPNDPFFVGQSLYAQAGVFDANAQASILPGLSLTQGLGLRLGL
jgi:hypothetical protein